MPHVVVEEAGGLQGLYQAFTPMVHRTGNEILKVQEFYLSRSGKDALEFLNDLPEGATLEGYSFPDTYSLPRDKVTARDVILTALRNFDKKVTPQMRADLQAGIRTLYDAIRLASIVEREAGC